MCTIHWVWIVFIYGKGFHVYKDGQGGQATAIYIGKYMCIHVYLQHNGFIFFKFESGWGFDCAWILGDGGGTGKISSYDFVIHSFVRNMIRRQKYKIQECMIDLNDPNI